MAASIRVRGSIVLVAQIALVNHDVLKHRTILVDPYSAGNRTEEVLSTRNSPTLKSSAPVPRSVDGGTAGCAKGGCIVLAGDGRSQACGASRVGSNSDLNQSAGPFPLALHGRYTDSTCTKLFMSNKAARTNLSMCA